MHINIVWMSISIVSVIQLPGASVGVVTTSQTTTLTVRTESSTTVTTQSSNTTVTAAQGHERDAPVRVLCYALEIIFCPIFT